VRTEKSHTTRDSVTTYVIFSENTIVPEIRGHVVLKKSLLKSETSRLIMINQVFNIGDVLLITVAVPRPNSHNEKRGTKKRKKKEAKKKRKN
jgi:flagellar basal body L-ring protein FlgH